MQMDGSVASHFELLRHEHKGVLCLGELLSVNKIHHYHQQSNLTNQAQLLINAVIKC